MWDTWLSSVLIILKTISEKTKQNVKEEPVPEQVKRVQICSSQSNESLEISPQKDAKAATANANTNAKASKINEACEAVFVM